MPAPTNSVATAWPSAVCRSLAQFSCRSPPGRPRRQSAGHAAPPASARGPAGSRPSHRPDAVKPPPNGMRRGATMVVCRMSSRCAPAGQAAVQPLRLCGANRLCSGLRSALQSSGSIRDARRGRHAGCGTGGSPAGAGWPGGPRRDGRRGAAPRLVRSGPAGRVAGWPAAATYVLVVGLVGGRAAPRVMRTTYQRTTGVVVHHLMVVPGQQPGHGGVRGLQRGLALMRLVVQAVAGRSLAGARPCGSAAEGRHRIRRCSRPRGDQVHVLFQQPRVGAKQPDPRRWQDAKARRRRSLGWSGAGGVRVRPAGLTASPSMKR